MVILSFLLVTTTVAQTNAPQQLSHAKRVYVDDKGNYFVQKSLPLYLKFSTTPDGKNYTLKSKKTPKYADPMYLDTEGQNTFNAPWAVDPTTMKTVYPKVEIVYFVYADGLPPYTKLSLTGAPRYVSQGKIFYGKRIISYSQIQRWCIRC